MAIFFNNNRAISHQMELAPFAADLILLQGSRFSPEYWRPVLEDLGSMPPAGGRILTCDWTDDGFKNIQPEDFVKLIHSLGLQQIHLVACDDAVELMSGVQRLQPTIFEKTLFYPNNAPRGEDLKRAVRAFCPI